MGQVINTNVAALNAQRNLDSSSSGLGVSLQRLSSGLRINSARDDAAGLAIATRFTSRIQGLGAASRNANDAISLAQVAEGALQESTKILQRARELALQSANGSNSAADRKALQAEVNQLKQELTRVSTTTSFNGLKILNGDLTNTAFQIGAEANQTVNVSISDTRTTAIGTNKVTTNNTNGIEQGTHVEFLGGGTSTDAAGVGTDIGIGSDAVTNGYVAETFTISNVTSGGSINTATATFSNNDDASTIASNLSAVSGVTATAFNQITLSAYSLTDTDSGSIELQVSGSNIDSVITIATTSDSDFSFMASEINSDTDLASAGVYALSQGTSVVIISRLGDDLQINNASTGGTANISVESAFDGVAASVVTSGITNTRGGRVDVTLNQGYTIQSGGTGIFGGTAATTLTTTATALTDVTAANSVAAQTLTVSGSTGSGTVSVVADDEASAIVTKINAITGTTNVKAAAVTTLTLQNLSADGTVTFDLFGDNVTTAPASISAAITTTDFTALVKAINDVAGNTGITAAADGANNVIKLTHATGKDIDIKNFTHSAGVNLVTTPTDSTVAITGDGSSTTNFLEATLDVIGNSANNSGETVQLVDGGTREGQDSTVVGGEISFTSSATFSVSSSIAGNDTGDTLKFEGGLLSGIANSGNSSSAQTVNTVDISSVAGAQSAIAVLDEAVNQISEIRADLGAVQSRFESAIRNLANNIENLNIARSRILDTDFAAETANLTKNQILTQAGISILAQANTLPQNILALLQ